VPTSTSVAPTASTSWCSCSTPRTRSSASTR
jgi:hypothetical protein